MNDGTTGPAGSQSPAHPDATYGPAGSPPAGPPAHPTPSTADPHAGGGRAGGADGGRSGGSHRAPGSRSRPGRGRVAAAAALAVVALAAGVMGVHVLDRPAEASAPDVGAIPVAAATTAASPGPSTQQDPNRRPATPRPSATKKAPPKKPAIQPAAPATLRIAGITAPVVATGVRRDGELEIPNPPSVVGWWVGSAPAGSPRNSTVIAGHVDSESSGVGALAVLRTIDLGTVVDVVDVFRTHHRYKVVARRTYDKHDLPADEVFAVRGPARLVLITCGGPFDERTRSYEDNVVVYATPVS